MKAKTISGAEIGTIKVFDDDRGRFAEIFRANKWSDFKLIQDNYSFSNKGVLRGLHYVSEPGQNQILTVMNGEIMDFLVDLRPESNSYLDYTEFHMTAYRQNQLFIPHYCAHGFLAMTDNVVLNYKADEYFLPDTDRTINFFDPKINIVLPDNISVIRSEKDTKALNWQEIGSGGRV